MSWPTLYLIGHNRCQNQFFERHIKRKVLFWIIMWDSLVEKKRDMFSILFDSNFMEIMNIPESTFDCCLQIIDQYNNGFKSFFCLLPTQPFVEVLLEDMDQHCLLQIVKDMYLWANLQVTNRCIKKRMAKRNFEKA